MGMSQSGLGGGQPSKLLIVLGLAALALVIAIAAQSGKTIPIDGVPGASPSATAGK